MIYTKLYGFKYSYLTPIICKQLYGFKYSCVMSIIRFVYWFKHPGNQRSRKSVKVFLNKKFYYQILPDSPPGRRGDGEDDFLHWKSLTSTMGKLKKNKSFFFFLFLHQKPFSPFNSQFLPLHKFFFWLCFLILKTNYQTLLVILTHIESSLSNNTV